MAIYTAYTLLAKEYTSVDPDFAGVFYWNDGEGYKEYVVDQNAFTSFTEALYAGGTVYGFSGSYTANNVVNNYGATLTSDALTIAWNAENNRFEATATPTEEPTTLTIKTKLTNNADTDFIVGSGVSISGSNNNPADIVNNGTFIVNTNSVVNANFSGEGKIVLTGTAFDSGIQIARGKDGVNNIDIANAATFTGSSLEGKEIKVLQTTDETNQNLVLNGATLKAETLTVTGYFYVLGDSSVSATTAASANSKKIYLGKSGNTAEVTLRDSTIVPGAGNLTGVELYHKEGTTAATTANILGKNDIATQIRSNSGTLNIGSATGDKTYLKSASILSFYDNAVGTTSINVNNAVLGVAEGNEVVADKKVSFTQYAGVITIENSVVVASSISAKNNRYFQIKGNSSLDVASLSGTITIIDGATLTKSAIAGADGKVSIESGKTVTFAGANSILSAIDNNGTILLAKDGEKAPKLTVNTISGNITVAEGAVDVTTTPAWVIKGTVNPGEDTVVTVPDSTYAIVDSGLYITKENVSTLFVDGGYDYGTDGSAITTDNHILGYNAFKSLANITANGLKDEMFATAANTWTASTVSLAAGTYVYTDLDVEEVAYYFAKTAKNSDGKATAVTFQGAVADGTEVTIKGENKFQFFMVGAVEGEDAVTSENYWNRMSAVSAMEDKAQKFVIADNLNLTVSSPQKMLRIGQILNSNDFDAVGKAERQAGTGDLTVNGTLNSAFCTAPFSRITVNGTLETTGKSYINAESLLVVNGAANNTPEKEDASQFNSGILRFIDGGTASFNNTRSSVEQFELNTNDYEMVLPEGYTKKVVVTMDNSIVDVSATKVFDYTTYKVNNYSSLPALEMTLKNGSTVIGNALNVGAEDTTKGIKRDVTVNVGAKDDTSSNALSVKSISNRGTINVYAGSSITVTDSFTNTGSGNITILGNADNRTFKSIDAQKGIGNSAAFSITDAFVNVSGDDFYNTTGGNLTIKNSLIKTNGGFALTSYDGTTTVYGSTINAALRIDGGVFTIGAGTSTLTSTLYGTSHTVNLANGAVLKDSNVQKLNTTTGKFVVANNASVEFSGTNTLSATITNNGTITINAGSSISANSIAGGKIALVTDDTVAADKATLFVTANLTSSRNTYFTVNGVDAFADAEALAAFYTGDIGSVAVAAAAGKSAYTLRRDGNKYSLIKTPSKETLYVGTAATLAGNPNYVLGYNAFYNLADALVEAYKESSVTTIKLLDKTSTTGVEAKIGKEGDDYLTLKNNLNITSDATTAVTATIGFANGDYGLMLNPADAANGALVIDKTIATTGDSSDPDNGAIYLNMKGVSKGSITVDGALETTNRIKIYGKTTVNGSLNAGEFVWVKAGAQAAAQEGLDVATSGLTINGTIGTDEIGTDEIGTDEKTTGRFYFASGVVTAASTATITAESFYFGQHVGGDRYITDNKEFVADEKVSTGYKAVLNSTGAKWNFTRDFSAGSTDDIWFNGEFNFNGGFINVHTTEPDDYKTDAWDGAEAGTVKIGAPVTLNLLNDATMTVGLNDGTHDFAGSVTNAGTINLKNGAELDVNGAVNNTNAIKVGAAGDANGSELFANSIENSGTIDLKEASVLDVSGAVNNTNAINVGAAGDEEASELIAGSFENSGTINAQAGSTIKAKAASTNKAGATINIGNKAVSAEDNDGTAIPASAATLDVSGNFTNSGTINVYGYVDGTADKQSLFKFNTKFENNATMELYKAKLDAGQWGYVYNWFGTITAVDSVIDTTFEANTGTIKGENSEFKRSVKQTRDNGASFSLVATGSGTSKINAATGVLSTVAGSSIRINQAGDVITAGATINSAKTDGKYATQIDVASISNAGIFNAAYADIKADKITNKGTFTMIGGSITGSTVANTGTGKFNASGDLALNIEKFSGTITLNDTATITNSTATSFEDTVAGAGAIETTAGKTVTFVGANTFTDAAFTNNGTITVNGSLTAGAISGTGTIEIDATDTLTATSITSGIIEIDGTKAFATEASSYTLISGAIADAVTIKIGEEGTNLVTNDLVTIGGTKYQVVRTGTDFVLNKVSGLSKANLLVTTNPAEITEDYLLNYNAFTNLADAIIGISDEETKSIEVKSAAAVTEAQGNLNVSGVAVQFEGENNNALITFKKSVPNDDPATGFKENFGLYLENGASITGGTITTAAESGNADPWCGTVYVNNVANATSVTIAGDIDAAGHIYFCGPATVTGKLTTSGAESEILFRAAKFAADSAVTIDGSVINSNWITMVSGKTEIKNSNVTIGSFGYDNYSNSDAAPIFGSTGSTWTIGEIDLVHQQTPGVERKAATINLDHSTFTVTGTANTNTQSEAEEAAEIGSAITLNLVNDSAISVANGTLKNAGIINVGNAATATQAASSATLSAKEIKNTGTINAYTESGITGTDGILNQGTITTTGDITVGELSNEAGAQITANNITASSKISNEGSITATKINSTIASGIAITNANEIGTATKSVDIEALGTVSNSGTIYAGALKAGRVENKAGSLTVSGLADVTQNIVISGGEATFNGGIKSLNLNAQLADSIININGGDVVVTGTIYATGTINANGVKLDNNTVSVTAETGTMKVTGASSLKNVQVTGTMTLDGVTLTDAKVTGNGTAVVSGAASTFSGSNSFGNLTVDGAALTIKAQAPAENVPCLTVNGGFENAGVITIDIADGISLAAGATMQIIGVTGDIVNSGSFGVKAAEGDENFYQVIVQADATVGSKGVYLFNAGKSDVKKETVVVDVTLDLSEYKLGDDVTFGGDTYKFGITAFKFANDIANLTDETKNIKFKTSSENYGNLFLNHDVNVTVTKTDGSGIGNSLVLTSTTIQGTESDLTQVAINATKTTNANWAQVDFGALNVTNAALSLNLIGEGATATAGATEISGSTVDFGNVIATLDETEISGSTVKFGGSATLGATEISGSTVDFAGEATLTSADIIGSTVTFKANGTIAGALKADANSKVNANGVKLTADSSVIKGTLSALGANVTLNNEPGTVTGTGTIFADIDSELHFTAGEGATFMTDIDVTKLTKDGIKSFDTNGRALAYFRASGTYAKGIEKYFDLVGGDLTQINGACYLYEVSNASDINDAVTYTWNGTDHADNVVLLEGVSAGTAAYFEGIEDQAVTIKGGKYTSVYGGKKIVNASTDKVYSTKVIGNEEKAIDVTINGGSFSKVVVGGDVANTADKATFVIRQGDIKLTVNGGTFDAGLAAGEMLYNKTNMSQAILAGDAKLTITGGTFKSKTNADGSISGWVYGGNFANNLASSARTTIDGTATVTIEAKADRKIDIQAGLVVGSYGNGIVGGTELILKGEGTKENLKIKEIWGGNSGDYYEKSTREYVSYGGDFTRTLTFSGFNGDLNCDLIRGFSVVNVEGKTKASLNDNATGLADVNNWTFELDSQLNGAFKNDFAGDTLVFSKIASMAVDQNWLICNDTSNFKFTGIKSINGVTGDDLVFDGNAYTFVADGQYQLSFGGYTTSGENAETFENAMYLTRLA